jgi:hypothetical protein
VPRIRIDEGLRGSYYRSEGSVDLLGDGRNFFGRGKVGHGGGVSARSV